VRSSSLVLAALLATTATSNVHAKNVTVAMDEVHMVTFDTPVKTVFVGNPVIADVTVVDSKRVFVLGKNFGTTNLVALNDAGVEIANDRITVSRSGSIVTLQRGTAQTTLNCGGTRCESAPAPGDDTEPFDTILGQMDKRGDQGLKAAGGGQ
jgi:hypothetical protein